MLFVGGHARACARQTTIPPMHWLHAHDMLLLHTIILHTVRITVSISAFSSEQKLLQDRRRSYIVVVFVVTTEAANGAMEEKLFSFSFGAFGLSRSTYHIEYLGLGQSVLLET